MAKTVYIKTALTGGASNALDGIDGSSIADGDLAHVLVSNVLYVYALDADLSGSEASPYLINPDTNPGTKTWVLQRSVGGQTVGASQSLTIAAGIVTAAGGGKLVIDTEGAAATDDLDRINGLTAGDRVILAAANDARTVVAKDGTYLKLQGDSSLDSEYDRMELECVGSDVCVELSRANNG